MHVEDVSALVTIGLMNEMAQIINQIYIKSNTRYYSISLAET